MAKCIIKMKDGGSISPEKAREILSDGTIRGKKITDKQRRFFGAMSNKAEQGGYYGGFDFNQFFLERAKRKQLDPNYVDVFDNLQSQNEDGSYSLLINGKQANKNVVLYDPNADTAFGSYVPAARNGAKIEQISDNPYSSPIIQFNGPDHSNGGIDIQYAGQQVEVEGRETGFVDQEGSLVVLGNLYVPGTKTKFKTVGKEIAEAEVKTAKQLDKSMTLINEADPYDQFGRMKFNSGNVMAQGAQIKQKQLSSVKEGIAALQNDMLEQANMLDIKPEQLQKGKAKFGIKMAQEGGTYQDPTTPKRLSLAQRNNNPGNLKYAAWMKKYGAVPGQAGTDGGNFAVFPTVQQGQQAMTALLKDKSYQNRSVMDAITRWTGGSPYGIVPDNLKNKKVSDLSPQEFNTLRDVITRGEDSKSYNWDDVPAQPSTPSTPPTVNLPWQPIDLQPIRGVQNRPINTNISSSLLNSPTSVTPLTPSTTTTSQTTRSAFRNPLRFGQIAPEVLTIATERAQFVPGQRFDPNLYQPYQVSFQDRLNENQANFNAISRQLGGNRNSAALASLAAQKYRADSQVLAEEFRTNQGITNDITNKNIALLNQAQLTNIELNDQQFVRQEQARANTRQNIRAAVQSISDKIQASEQQNMSYNFARQIVAPQFGVTPRTGDLQRFDNPGLQFGQPNPSSTFTPNTTRR